MDYPKVEVGYIDTTYKTSTERLAVERVCNDGATSKWVRRQGLIYNLLQTQEVL